MKNKSYGLTVIELLVTVSVLAVCATLAAPTMTFIHKMTVESTAHDFANSIKRAREEAKRSQVSGTYTVCASAQGSECSGSWADGLIVFNDVDANGSRSSNEQVVLVQAGVSSVTASVKSSLPYVLFTSDGALHGLEKGMRISLNHARYPSSKNTYHVCVLRDGVYVVEDRALNEDNRYARCKQIG